MQVLVIIHRTKFGCIDFGLLIQAPTIVLMKSLTANLLTALPTDEPRELNSNNNFHIQTQKHNFSPKPQSRPFDAAQLQLIVIADVNKWKTFSAKEKSIVFRAFGFVEFLAHALNGR